MALVGESASRLVLGGRRRGDFFALVSFDGGFLKGIFFCSLFGPEFYRLGKSSWLWVSWIRFFFLIFELDIPSGVNDYIFFCLMS